MKVYYNKLVGLIGIGLFCVFCSQMMAMEQARQNDRNVRQNFAYQQEENQKLKRHKRLALGASVTLLVALVGGLGWQYLQEEEQIVLLDQVKQILQEGLNITASALQGQ